MSKRGHEIEGMNPIHYLQDLNQTWVNYCIWAKYDDTWQFWCQCVGLDEAEAELAEVKAKIITRYRRFGAEESCSRRIQDARIVKLTVTREAL